MSTVDAFLAPAVTEALLAALSRVRSIKSWQTPPHLAIGSPWLSDAPLFPGIFAGSFPHLLPDATPEDVATIGSVLTSWIKSGGKATVLVKSYDPTDKPSKTHRNSNLAELKFLKRALAAGVEVLIGAKFHAKFLLVPELVLHGSANATYHGIYQNRELLTLASASPQASPASYASLRAICENFLDSARLAGPCSPPKRAYGVIATAQDIEKVRTCFESSWT